MADPEEYRTKEQVEEWRERDPLKTFAGPPRRRGHARRGRRRGDRRGGRLDRRRGRRASPTQSPHPEPESLYDDIYVLGDQVRGWYSLDERAAGVHRGEHERDEPQDGARREQFEAVVESQSADVGGED